MCDRDQLINSIKQTPTPLNTLYFSDFNIDLIQRGIRQKFKDETGISIDYQKRDDVFAIMRVVFINNAGNQMKNVNEQVKFMNSIVIETALSQVRSGVAGFLGYMKDISDTATSDRLNDLPVNTSTVGKKMPINNKIGLPEPKTQNTAVPSAAPTRPMMDPVVQKPVSIIRQIKNTLGI